MKEDNEFILCPVFLKTGCRFVLTMNTLTKGFIMSFDIEIEQLNDFQEITGIMTERLRDITDKLRAEVSRGRIAVLEKVDRYEKFMAALDGSLALDAGIDAVLDVLKNEGGK